MVPVPPARFVHSSGRTSSRTRMQNRYALGLQGVVARRSPLSTMSTRSRLRIDQLLRARAVSRDAAPTADHAASVHLRLRSGTEHRTAPQHPCRHVRLEPSSAAPPSAAPAAHACGGTTPVRHRHVDVRRAMPLSTSAARRRAERRARPATTPTCAPCRRPRSGWHRAWRSRCRAATPCRGDSRTGCSRGWRRSACATPAVAASDSASWTATSAPMSAGRMPAHST